MIDTWKSKTVAFIGDSITDGVGTTKTYHDMLAEEIGFTALNYGVNGAQVSDMIGFADKLHAEHPGVDAIFVFGGTNDYNSSVLPGEPYGITVENVNHDGVTAARKKRVLNMDTLTFWGRINTLMLKLRTGFPDAQVILMTPIHRGYAEFGADNVQPCDDYANACGLFIDDYVNAVKRAGEIWSAPVIDLFGESGLVPALETQSALIHDPVTDRLHPNAAGHEKMAKLIRGWLNVYACR